MGRVVRVGARAARMSGINMLGPSLNGGSHNVGGGNMSLGTYLLRIRSHFIIENRLIVVDVL